MFQRTTAINKIAAMTMRKKVIPGGSSAGKTYSIIPLLINTACQQPANDPLEISIVSHSIPHLKKGAMKDFLKIMRQTGRYVDERWNRTDFIYRFWNDTYIEFFSVDQEDKVRGPRRHILYGNEINMWTWETYHQLAMRTSKDIYLDYNPSHEFWVHKELIGEPDVEVLTLTYLDNEALEDTIVAEFERAKEKAAEEAEKGIDGYWTNYWKVYGLGQLGSLKGAIITDWEIVKEFPKNAKKVGYGLDFGFTNDPTTCIKCGIYDGCLYVQQMIYETGLVPLHNKKQPKQKSVQRRLKQLGIKKISQMVGDRSSPTALHLLRNAGYSIEGSRSNKGDIIAGIAIMQSMPMKIVEGSADIVTEVVNWRWLPHPKTGDMENKPMVDAYNHAMDAIRYWCLKNLKGPVT